MNIREDLKISPFSKDQQSVYSGDPKTGIIKKTESLKTGIIPKPELLENHTFWRLVFTWFGFWMVGTTKDIYNT